MKTVNLAENLAAFSEHFSDIRSFAPERKVGILDENRGSPHKEGPKASRKRPIPVSVR